MRTRVRFRIGGLAVLAGAVLFLCAATASATDKPFDPTKAPVKFKYHFPPIMSGDEILQYEKRVDDRSDFSNQIEATPNFVPGTAAVNGIESATSVFGGIVAGRTTYDYQANGPLERQIQLGYGGSPAHRWVHVTWMCLKVFILTDPSRQINYNCYKWHGTPGWTLNTDDFGGVTVTPAGNRGGYCALDVNSAGNAIVGWHSAVVGGTAYSNVSKFSIPGLGTFVTDLLSNPVGHTNIWPKLGISHLTNDIYHVVSEDSGPGAGDPAVHCYWRYLTSPAGWQGPVIMDSAMTLSQIVRANGNRVVYILTKPRDYSTSRNQLNNDIGYYESLNAGESWITNNGPTAWASGGGHNVTNYQNSDMERAYIDQCAGFDNVGRLHICYTAPYYKDMGGGTFEASTGACIYYHWDEGVVGSNGKTLPSPGGGGKNAANFNTIKYAMWGMPGQGDANDGSCGVWNRHVSKMSLAFGDGSRICDGNPNLDYLYTTYTQFGSENTLDKQDVSKDQYMNGNIWLSISNDLGLSWGAQKCITTVDGIVGHTPTRSPGCDFSAVPPETCLSEHWSSCASLVNDTLHAFYDGDLSAGGIPQTEGDWATNGMMYLPIFGNATGNPLCPVISPVLNVTLTGDPNCEYFSDLGKPFSSETLTIANFGNATLNYGARRVYINGTGWLALNGGDTITATSIVKGGAPNTYPVDMDGSALPNGLYQAYIRLWHTDTLPGTGQPNPKVIVVNYIRADTVACIRGVVMTTPGVALDVSNLGSWGQGNSRGGMRYYSEPDADSNFNPFFDGSLTIADRTKTNATDTIVYRDIFSNRTGSNPGFRALEYPKLSYNAASNESIVSANLVSIDSAIDISVQYLFPQDAINSEFVRVQFRISSRVPATEHLIIGAASDIDAPGSDANGIGSENVGGVIPSYNMVYQHGTDTVRAGGFHRETNKYVAGMTAITCTPVNRLKVGSNRNDVYPVNGFKDGYIFRALNGTGNQIWADSADDIHSIVSIKDITLNDQKAYVYQIGLVTSLAGQTGVKADQATYKSPYEGYVADLMATAGKAWKKAFGWCGDFWMTGGSLTLPTASSDILIAATGTHEDGLAGGCCGCNFTLVSVIPSPTAGSITVVDNGDCTGRIDFEDVWPGGDYTLTMRVADLCGEQTDEVEIQAKVPEEAPPEPEVAEIPVIVNIYHANGNPTTTEAEARKAIEEANKILKQANQKLVVKKINNPPGAGNGDDGDGKFTQAERKNIRTFGGTELGKTKGIKICFGLDPEAENDANPGTSRHKNPTIMVRDRGAAPLTGQSIASRIATVETLNKGHKIDANTVADDGAHAPNKDGASGNGNLMAPIERRNGTYLTPDQITEMNKWVSENIGKGVEQKDQNAPPEKKKEQFGGGNDERKKDKDISSSEDCYDLDQVFLASVAGDASISAHIMVGLFSEASVDTVEYALGFDIDSNGATGWMGMDRIVHIYVRNTYGIFSASGEVEDIGTGDSVSLPTSPLVATEDEFYDVDEPATPTGTSVAVDIPKSLLNLAVPEVPVTVLAGAHGSFFDSLALVFDTLRWEDYPTLTVFGDCIPTPGQLYPFEVSGLQAHSPLNLFVDDTLVLSGQLDGVGSYAGNFLFPGNLSAGNWYFLTAQDETGEFAYNVTCLGGGNCYCGLPGRLWADISRDGQVNPLDVVRMVNYVYKSQQDALEYPTGGIWNCLQKLGDVNWDGAVNPVDIVRYVNFVYKGVTSAICNNPCSGSCQ